MLIIKVTRYLKNRFIHNKYILKHFYEILMKIYCFQTWIILKSTIAYFVLQRKLYKLSEFHSLFGITFKYCAFNNLIFLPFFLS